MKTSLCLPFLMVVFILSACKKDETITPKKQPKRDKISFTGTWMRQFEAGAGNLHTVKYIIYQDSIRYIISGSFGNADYIIKRDTFMLNENRFIGHFKTNMYLIFIKNVSNDSITLYKQEVFDISEGVSTSIPEPKTKENHGWNTYHKK